MEWDLDAAWNLYSGSEEGQHSKQGKRNVSNHSGHRVRRPGWPAEGWVSQKFWPGWQPGWSRTLLSLKLTPSWIILLMPLPAREGAAYERPPRSLEEPGSFFAEHEQSQFSQPRSDRIQAVIQAGQLGISTQGGLEGRDSQRQETLFRGQSHC